MYLRVTEINRVIGSGMKKSINILALVVLITVSTTAFADAKALYKDVCYACHDNSVSGAPKFKDKAAWAPRIAKGIDALVRTVITGKGGMPPMGGSPFTEAQIREVVIYMTNAAK